ncbi:leucyl aminopeptidase family protein [Candidatus Sumerlaeota bacterium]|nr:leucyl aminopeptidase family protein [Candidatus Sumerlaeota bacterium]
MKIRLSAKTLTQSSADMAVFLVDTDKEFFTSTDKFLKSLCQRYLKGVKEERIRQEMVVTPPASLPFKCVYFYAPSLSKYYTYDETVKIAVDRAREYASNMGYRSILFLLNAKDGTANIQNITEGLLLGVYSFDKYKTNQKKGKNVQEAALLVGKSSLGRARKLVDSTSALCTIINECRDVINEPPDKIYPDSLARIAMRLARAHGLKYQIFKEQQLKQMGYNGILSVGRGSQYPPRLVVIHYFPPGKKSVGKTKKHLCIIGKGVTYDTGGVCLKPPKNMWEMKSDMAGAAVVIFAMAVLARVKPSYRITAIAPLAQNAIGKQAVLPGEIITSPAGKSIHIQNTDAEGRLLLVDALHHATTKLKATHIVDVATLTGSIIRALGESLSGLFVNDPEFANLIIECGKKAGEDIWLMPLYEEYRQFLKSKVADVENISSSPYAGSITAALFLKEFVPSGVKWAHLDIAGTAFRDKKWKYYSPGATGYALKTIVKLAESL